MGFLSAIMPGIVSGISALAQGGPKRQYKWNMKAAQETNQMNRANQQWLLEQEKQLQSEQRAYDSPEAQMSRYKKAGLNPHLIYGSGSSAGQAFPVNAGTLPGARVDAPSASYPDIATGFLQASQSLAQTGLTTAKTNESGVKAELISIQNAIAANNPMLDSAVAEWVSTSMLESAKLKAMESRVWLSRDQGEMRVSKKVNAEIDALTQKLGLNTLDLQVKNKILMSKEFENALKEIQVNFMKDADVSPGHIIEFVKLLLLKMM